MDLEPQLERTPSGPTLQPAVEAGWDSRQGSLLWWLPPLGLAALVLYLAPWLDREVELLLVAWTLMACLVVHELGHAWMARLEGDDTAHRAGRLDPSPLAHFDPVGSFLTPLVTGGLTWLVGSGLVVGWAKPIPVVPAHFQSPRSSPFRVALAGPLANLALLYLTMVGTTFLILIRGVNELATDLLPIDWLMGAVCPPEEPVFFLALTVARWSLLFNALLVVLNLLPVPPFDGARVVVGLAPVSWRPRLQRLQRWALGLFPVLIGLGQSALLLWPVAFLWYAALWPVGVLTGAPLPELFP